MAQASTDLDNPVERHNMRLIGHNDMGGEGDGMHINLHKGHAFFAHMGERGTSILDVRDPRDPRLVGRVPAPKNTHSHKVQIVGDVMLVNRERAQPPIGGDPHRSWVAGISVYDVSEPTQPEEIGFWSCGGIGVHRMTYWSEPYAFVTAGGSQFEQQFLVILDLSDPTMPTEVARWWYPGMRRDEQHLRTYDKGMVKVHHALPRGDRLYVGLWDMGLGILDISDIRKPELIGQLDLDAVDPTSRNTHTVCPIPGRDAVVVTDEATERYPIDYHARLVDISDETAPRFVSRLPVPEGDWPSIEERELGRRFGPHNVHEPRPGSLQRGDLVFLTYFGGGLRVYDISDLAAPREVAAYVPQAPPGRPAIQLNDLTVDENGLLYVSDRMAGGLYIFELDEGTL